MCWFQRPFLMNIGSNNQLLSSGSPVSLNHQILCKCFFHVWLKQNEITSRHSHSHYHYLSLPFVLRLNHGIQHLCFFNTFIQYYPTKLCKILFLFFSVVHEIIFTQTRMTLNWPNWINNNSNRCLHYIYLILHLPDVHIYEYPYKNK